MASRTRAKLNNLNDRAREVGRPSDERLEKIDIEALTAFFDYTCLKCGFNPAISPDHVLPLSLGGMNTVENLQLLCDSCNKSKGDDATDYRNGRIMSREFVEDFAKSQQEPQKDRRIKHDWDEIEFEYIHAETLPSLRDLAQKFGVSLSHIGLISAREDWQRKRENYRNKIGTEAELAALQEQIDIRLEIDRTTLDFLRLWRRQHNEIGNQDLIKILELGARASGLELDKKTFTLKDWRDVAAKGGDDSDDIQKFATDAAADYYGSDSGGDTDASTGWTD